MPVSKQKIKQCFNKAAETYDAHSHIQHHTGCTLISSIKKIIQQANNILELGCGTGFISELLAKQIPFQHFEAVDIADQLLIKARERLRYAGVTVYEKDFDTLTITNHRYQLIFSNMSLQWSVAFKKTMQTIFQLLTEDGLFACTLPLAGTFDELPVSSRNHFFTFDFLCTQLISAGYELLFAHNEQYQMPFASPLEALRSIKATGAHYVKQSNATSRGLSAWTRHCNTNALTYCIGYFIARKPSDA